MAPDKATAKDRKAIERLLRVFDANAEQLERTQENLHGLIFGSRKLAPFVHSVKSRVKERSHLEQKLLRKFPERRGHDRTVITAENLFTEVNDLVGVRILHLYTRQFAELHAGLIEILDEQNYTIIEGPVARTWDLESRRFFESLDVECVDSETMYTSVHYVVGTNTKTNFTCEIQVRTLMEEVWGEVNHALNYPDESPSHAAREQLKVLARATSTATSLVDSIFVTHELEEKRLRDLA